MCKDIYIYTRKKHLDSPARFSPRGLKAIKLLGKRNWDIEPFFGSSITTLPFLRWSVPSPQWLRTMSSWSSMPILTSNFNPCNGMHEYHLNRTWATVLQGWTFRSLKLVDSCDASRNTDPSRWMKVGWRREEQRFQAQTTTVLPTPQFVQRKSVRPFLQPNLWCEMWHLFQAVGKMTVSILVGLILNDVSA